MDNQKADNLLNLALEATPSERQRSLNLDTGFDALTDTWDLIVKYSGDIRALENERTRVVPLLNNYAIVTIKEAEIEKLFSAPQVEFVEKPKRLFFASVFGRRISCINTVQTPPEGLTGRGILVGIVDSGVDIYHADFRRTDGTTRIAALWDQTLISEKAPPPKGYYLGSFYDEKMINDILNNPDRPAVVPGEDLSGHGTAVLGIAAGGTGAGSILPGGAGAVSRRAATGIAFESSLAVVKLGTPKPDGFPRTTELMQAVNFLIETALSMNMPLVINISFGNSYGAHNGMSLLESYLDAVAGVWKNCIVIGTGNEGARQGHTAGRLSEGMTVDIPFVISEYERAINVQIWKNGFDVADVELVAPGGQKAGPLQQFLGAQRFVLEGTEILLYYGEASPYTMAQEIYIDFLPSDTYITPGIWTVRLYGRRIADGQYHLWLPGSAARNLQTRFLYPEPEYTLTVPSTALKPIAVGAYNGYTDAYADFSGRGFTVFNQWIKPDLAAPGVDIQTTKSGGGYASVTGTSFAAPFVSGSCALLMEDGIIRGNDPYLYGEKVKSALIKGARRLPGIENYPDRKIGWGALCLRDSLL